MIVCGLKLTHDGAVAVLDGNRLIFSTEMEKLANNRRYSQVQDLTVVPQLLADHGLKVDDVDAWVVDGWDGADTGSVALHNEGTPLELTLAPYRENDVVRSLLQPGYAGVLPIGGEILPYRSYVHVAGHLASAYGSSPFATAGQPAVVLIWDGGLFPRLYFVGTDGGVDNGGELFPLIGHSYATAAHHFGPYRREDEAETVDDLGVAGKLMAYVALGTARPEIQAVLAETFHEHFEADTPRVAAYRREIRGVGSNGERSMRHVHAFFRDVRARLEPTGAGAEDVLASVHQFLEDLLVERTVARVRHWRGDGPHNLCFVGGCALNIKWNSALRAHPLFTDVWVPPFPNDSGSAIGTATAHLATLGGGTAGRIPALDWSVRLGPALGPVGGLPAGWTSSPCDPAELARYLHETGRPVVVLDGRAELGPRALGGRSILAAATDPAMKDELNAVKDREHYRPVAPICLVEHAPAIFDPGTPDPYMLFDHRVRPDWLDRVPAIVHLDGTARLQTVAQADAPVLHRILAEYHRLSGIPVLCNTSANHHGRGFFPDVASALEWRRVDAVWSDNRLYRCTARTFSERTAR